MYAPTHLFDLPNAQSNRPPEVLHENLRLLDLGRVDLRPNHRTEWHLLTQLMSDTEGQGSLSRTGASSEEQSLACEALTADEVEYEAAGLR